jgi:outer membrane receptor for ferrienterochelin and colicin
MRQKRLILLSGLAGCAFTFCPLAAQDDMEELDLVTVTGSLIPRSETALEANPIPVDIVTSEDIQSSGYSTAAELLQQMSVNNGGAVPLANNATGFTPGASSVSLRGLGPETSLVLINGRRVAPYPTGTGGTTAFVDLNTIPLAAIERIEVLKDGASATYGADAVAGVVNIITKSDYVGAETTVRYGNTVADTDSSELTWSFLTGASTESTSITIGGSLYKRNPIFQADRDYSAVPPFLSANSSPLNIEVSRAAAIAALERRGLTESEALNRIPDSFSEGYASGNLTSEEIGVFEEDAELIAQLPYGDRFGLVIDPSETEGIGEEELAQIRSERRDAYLSLVRNAFGSDDFFYAPIRTTSGPTLLGSPYPEDQYFDGFPGTETNNANNMGDLPATAYAFYGDAFINDSRFNYNLTAGAVPEVERYGAFLTFEHEPFAMDNVTVYGDMIFTNTYARSELAPTATGAFYDPGSTPLVIPARTPNPIAHPNEEAILGGDRPAADGAFNPFNPFNQDLTWGTQIRTFEFGNRIYENDNDAFNATLGIEFADIADTSWSVDGALRYSIIEENFFTRQISVSRFNRILNANDSFFDPNSSDYVGTTQPYNPFGYFRNPIPNNTLVAPNAIVETNNYSTSEIQAADLLITNPELVEMGAGPVGFAFGVDWRHERIYQNPDAIAQQGDIMGSSPRAVTRADRQINGFFAEFEVPLVNPDSGIPGLYKLDTTVAGRFERFTTSGRDTFVPKLSARWMPLDESILIRGTWQESYREPSLFQLFSGQSRGLLNLQNPLTGLTETEVSVSTTGNPNLDAEEAESYSLGVVYTPDYVPGLSVAVDLWYIERDGVVTADYDSTIQRGIDGELLEGESVLFGPNDELLQVNALFNNTSNYEVKGIDFEVGYVYETANLGVFDMRVVASYLDERLFSFSDEESFTDTVGEATDFRSNNGYLRWKGTGNLQWIFENWTVNLNAVYTDGFNDAKYADIPGFDFSVVEFEVEDRLIWNLNASYTLFGDVDEWYKDITITAGIDNLFDEDPPFADGLLGNSTGYPNFLYTPEGGFYWVQITKKF